MNLTPFTFGGQPLRIQTDPATGQPWFNANDVCAALEYANPRDAISKHVDEGDVAKRDTPSTSGVQAYNYVNESGLYALIFGSRLESARRFKRWVTAEVLPAIRKTGGYGHGSQPLLLDLLTQRLVPAVERLKKLHPLSQAYSLANQAIHQDSGIDLLARLYPPGYLDTLRAQEAAARPKRPPLDLILRHLKHPHRLIPRHKQHPHLIPFLQSGLIPRQILLKCSHLSAHDFDALINQAIQDGLITEHHRPDYSGTLYTRAAPQ